MVVSIRGVVGFGWFVYFLFISFVNVSFRVILFLLKIRVTFEEGI